MEEEIDKKELEERNPVDLEQKHGNESNQDYMERVERTTMFNIAAVADRIKKVKHKNRNGPRSKMNRTDERKEIGRETEQIIQIEIGRDERKQVEERKTQNARKKKYTELSIRGRRNQYGRSKAQLNCKDRETRDKKNEKKTRTTVSTKQACGTNERIECKLTE